MADKTEQIEVQSVLEFDAANAPYRELNTRVRNAAVGGAQKIIVRSVHCQRYIGTNLGQPVEVEIYGTPGSDLGAIEDHQLSKEAGRADLDEKNPHELRGYVTEFAGHFGYNADEILSQKFTKVFPLHLRPFGTPYAY